MGAISRALGLVLPRRIARRLPFLFHIHQWHVAYSLDDGPLSPAVDPSGFRRLYPPRDRMWADPFPVVQGERRAIFVEEKEFRSGRGRIAVMEIDQQGGVGKPVTVLERDHHLSYPQVFAWNGDLHMVPESASNRTVDMYRCVSFPHIWEHEAELLSGVRAYDPTLVEVDGRWWMFANVVSDGGGLNRDLFLYHAESPLGPWTPHGSNPVRSDVNGTRPAGRLFRSEGRLYRPAQDCTVRYGHSIVINQVVRLDDAGYEEREAGRIPPTWGASLIGTHTLNAWDGLTVVDGLARRPKYWGMPR